jgi:anti-sigma factor ChrR (cupin superfamily)
MQLNDELGIRVALATDELAWIPSPTPGVERRMLERDGLEVARATSIVRYRAGSQFPEHVHERGEEFLVLEGEFVDEHGRYPTGTYVRNPWGTKHAPAAPQGCILFVKLRQMAQADQTRVVIEATHGNWQRDDAPFAYCTLHEYGSESVRLERWSPTFEPTMRSYPRGAEFFVLAGSFEDASGQYGTHTWLRLPAGASHSLRSQLGCTLYVKTGHLTQAA